MSNLLTRSPQSLDIIRTKTREAVRTCTYTRVRFKPNVHRIIRYLKFDGNHNSNSYFST